MLYKIHYNGTKCHVGGKWFGENLLSFLGGASRH